MRRIYCHNRNNALMFERGQVGWAGNSGFQGFNLALQFGARRIALCGFDCDGRHGIHFHGKHPANQGLNNPTQAALDRWRLALDSQAGILESMGVEVFVATHYSRLANYPRRPLMELLHELRERHTSSIAAE